MFKRFFKRRRRSTLFVVQNDMHMGSAHRRELGFGLEESLADQLTDDHTTGHHYIGSTVSRTRLKIGFFLLFSIIFIFTGRSAHLQIVNGEHYQNLSSGNSTRTQRVIPSRGIIRDRYGSIVADNVPTFQLTLVIADLPKDALERETVLRRAVELSGLQRTDIDLLLTDYAKTPFDQVPVKKNIPYEAAMRLAIETSDLPGFTLETSSRRNYKSSSISLSHVLGYSGKISPEELERQGKAYKPIDDIGKTGIEKSAEAILRGVPGSVVSEVDAFGRSLSIVSRTEPIQGGDITLSIDLPFQKYVENRLQATLNRVGATKGSVVAIDPQTGAVRALVSLPAFDNNLFAEGIDNETYLDLISDEDNPLFFRAVSGEFPSGSTFKPFVAYAAMAEGIVGEHSSFLSTGGLSIGQWYFPDWKAGGHGITNVRKAISESVNTYFYIIGGGFQQTTGLGVDRIVRYAKRFGFGEPTGITLPSEADGFLPSKTWKEEAKGERWYVGDTYHLAIGQGDFLTTPLQMSAATAVIANGGSRVTPYLIETVDGGTGLTDFTHEAHDVEELDEFALHVVRQGMRQTITTGSARSLSDLPEAVAGKTGTAQTIGDRPYHSWFTGLEVMTPLFRLPRNCSGGGSPLSNNVK